MLLILSSLLVGATIAFVLNSCINPCWIWFSRMCEDDAVLYRKWADDIFIKWPPSYAFNLALFKNAGIFLGGIFLLLFIFVSTIFTGFAFAALAIKIFIATVLVVAAYYLPPHVYKYYKEKQLQKIEEQLPDAINIMVSSVRAGRSLPQAIDDVVEKTPRPIKSVFEIVQRENRLGISVYDSLLRAKNRLDIDNFKMLVSALSIGHRRGGELLNILERISASVRELMRLKKKIIIETTEVRIQQKIIIFMTPVFLVIVLLFDSGTMQILFNTVGGILLLVIVAILEIIAIFWIRRIIKAAI